MNSKPSYVIIFNKFLIILNLEELGHLFGEIDSWIPGISDYGVHSQTKKYSKINFRSRRRRRKVRSTACCIHHAIPLNISVIRSVEKPSKFDPALIKARATSRCPFAALE